jgi:hypothetical protein
VRADGGRGWLACGKVRDEGRCATRRGYGMLLHWRDLETVYWLLLIDYLPDMDRGYKGGVVGSSERYATRLVYGLLLHWSNPKTLYGRFFIDHLPDKDCGYKLSGAILHISDTRYAACRSLQIGRPRLGR